MDALKEANVVAQTNTRSDATAEVRLTFDEFWRLPRDPVSERAPADAKVNDRQLSADDRNAGRHRRTGLERNVLRAADRDLRTIAIA